MTYKELQDKLNTMSKKQLGMDVTVYIREEDEYFPLVTDYPVCESDEDENDVLDHNHPYLVI